MKRRSFLAGLSAAAFALVLSLKPPELGKPKYYLIGLDFTLQDLSLENLENAISHFILRQSDRRPTGSLPQGTTRRCSGKSRKCGTGSA